jgi:OFA family oxalate/formate antiporter-like MFS transporter
VANLCQGAAYSFSVFKGPLMEHLRCSEKEVALAFTLAVAFLPVGMLISGRLADRRSPRLVVALGGTLFGLGMFLGGFSHTLIWLYLTYGVMLSIGSGAAYGAVVGSAVKWYPTRRGMAGGIVVGALGLGTCIIAWAGQKMIQMPSLGVLGTLKVLGAAIVVMTVGSSIFIVNPPEGQTKPEPEAEKSEPVSSNDVDWLRMVIRPRFWLLYVIYAAGAFSGLMVISQAFTIAQELTHLAPAAAALVVSVMGLANAGGRLFWGTVSDKIGRIAALALMFAVTAVVMLAFTSAAATSGGVTAAVALVALCYGGYLGIFPSICADAFGSRNLTVNYGVLFTAFSLAAVLGPRVCATLKESTGGYAGSFHVAFGVATAGLVLCVVAGATGKRKPARQS